MENFKIEKKSKISNARLGKLKTSHGIVKTPFFMPVATRGVAKHLTADELKKVGADIILSNTYHLMLRPGEKHVKKMGGLHEFMGWSGPILTDSGGYQVFSLAGNKRKEGKSLVKIDDNGVKFYSYIDGSIHYLTPEKAFDIQRDLGVDIAVCLDECPPHTSERKYMEQSIALTADWAKKTKNHYRKVRGKKPLLFAVVQGGLDNELRKKSLESLVDIGFDGYNIGGLSVGETAKQMYSVLDFLLPLMPDNKPRYLMGVGYPDNIVEAVKRGVDMFDCVIPTREGRHGRLFMQPKRDKRAIYSALNIKSAKFASDRSSVNPDSKIPELQKTSKAYLHYLFKIDEPLGQRLATLNNLEFYLTLMKNLRDRIKNGEL